MQYCCIYYFCFMKLIRLTSKLDSLGMTASSLCAVHCALIPMMVTFLPLWGLEFLSESWVELMMIAIALVLGTVSLSISYKKHHKNKLPLLLLCFGFMLIAAGHFLVSETIEPLVIPAGGFIIAAAHYKNWKFSRCRLDTRVPHLKS